eukprot:TRINITY_DN4604_c1_g1_i1.p1 TRINITY_DN4604_c1_g1~~TRINITY_DN4604_c1_g1_i1.p1  ORF type:complete len:114 (+),score=12.81 TRINITY_DN4604_c1_g1_i1:378-719(+)
MFFFFVGGVEQQVRQVLKSGVQRCIRCGSAADLVEYEKVLKLFFVPVWRWPGKEAAIYCNNCSLFYPSSFNPPDEAAADSRRSPLLSQVLRCHSCSRVLDPDFRFCPFCGTQL